MVYTCKETLYMAWTGTDWDRMINVAEFGVPEDEETDISAWQGIESGRGLASGSAALITRMAPIWIVECPLWRADGKPAGEDTRSASLRRASSSSRAGARSHSGALGTTGLALRQLRATPAPRHVRLRKRSITRPDALSANMVQTGIEYR
jgi:hypothetical protein